MANERLEGGLVNYFSFVEVDRAAYVAVETRVKETGRILQRRALGWPAPLAPSSFEVESVD